MRSSAVWLAFLLGYSLPALAGPRAYLQTDPGYIKADTLVVGERSHKTSNALMSTFDIEEFEYLKSSDPNAYQALWNHDRYGVVGTRGLVAGIVVSGAIWGFWKDQVHVAIPVGAFLAGFTYFMNCRYMARHYLHNAINTLNGVVPPKRDSGAMIRPFLIANRSTFALGVELSW